MASSWRTAALAAACMLLLFVLALCEASRPILLLHESANASIPALHDAIHPANVGTAVGIAAQPASLQSTSHVDVTARYELAAHATPGALFERDCHTSNIIIEQFEASGVGLPTFQVQISNSCTNPLCSISFVIVRCGLFHSGESLVNPKVFRRWEQMSGTCIVNDGQPIRNADTIRFQYKEIWKQPITFLSARVFCHGHT